MENNIQIVESINLFPIGDIAKTREELLSKTEIVSFLSRFQDQFQSIENIDEREALVKEFLGGVIGLQEGEVIPSLPVAERTLQLSNGFVQDYSKVQLIKENNKKFDETYDLIADSMGLEKPKTL